MRKLWCVVCILALWNSARPSASTPIADCGSVIYEILECISYLIDGSNESKPVASCCAAFESMLDVGDECVCQAIKESAQMDIPLNLTRVLMLPPACALSVSPISKCHIHVPAPSPKNAPTVLSPVPPPSKATSPAPTTPSQAGPTNAAHSISISISLSFLLLIVGIYATSLCL